MTPCGRRAFLAAAARTAAGLGAVPLLGTAGCGAGDAADEGGPLRLPLADLPEGRSAHAVGGRPVEVLRRGDAVSARSLLCTHQGCVVAWRPDEDAYVCPCHDGRFDPQGRPVYGPPRDPLRGVQVTRDGDEVVVGG